MLSYLQLLLRIMAMSFFKKYIGRSLSGLQRVFLNTERRTINCNIAANIIIKSLVMRKPDFRICGNKDADQLRGNREADQRLCFRYRESTIPLLSTSKISSP